jgi:hypothetical protein
VAVYSFEHLRGQSPCDIDSTFFPIAGKPYYAFERILSSLLRGEVFCVGDSFGSSKHVWL